MTIGTITMTKCPDCGGSGDGKHRYSCERCKGGGRVRVDATPPPVGLTVAMEVTEGALQEVERTIAAIRAYHVAYTPAFGLCSDAEWLLAALRSSLEREAALVEALTEALENWGDYLSGDTYIGDKEKINEQNKIAQLRALLAGGVEGQGKG